MTLVHPDDLPEVMRKFSAFVEKKHKHEKVEYRIRCKDGSYLWWETIGSLLIDNDQIVGIVFTSRDITERKKIEAELIDSKMELELFFQSSLGLMCIVNTQGEFLRLNPEWEHVLGYPLEYFIGKKTADFIHPDDKKDTLEALNTLKSETYIASLTNRFICKDGSYRYIEWRSKIVGNLIYASAKDVTENLERMKEIEFLSFHDHLTGLYNRRFFETEITRLDTARNWPLTIIFADVNGLKVINDSFGHKIGDQLLIKVSEVLKAHLRSEDIIARIGGDEFAILLPKTDEAESKKMIAQIENQMHDEKVEGINISISFGHETKIREDESISDILKKAEDKMYHIKLFEGPSNRGKIIDNIVKSLYMKSAREEAHSKRVAELCLRMAVALNFDELKVKEIMTAGLLHDIGKIIIDDEVLNKPGELNDQEWIEMKRHPEAGYRILSTVDDMVTIAKYVLCHHERWDGRGYPKGLSGNEIPYISRILAVADAYDAMTNRRSYKRAISKKDAIAELIRSAGTHFDSQIVEIFIEKVL